MLKRSAVLGHSPDAHCRRPVSLLLRRKTSRPRADRRLHQRAHLASRRRFCRCGPAACQACWSRPMWSGSPGRCSWIGLTYRSTPTTPQRETWSIRKARRTVALQFLSSSNGKHTSTGDDHANRCSRFGSDCLADRPGSGRPCACRARTRSLVTVWARATPQRHDHSRVGEATVKPGGAELQAPRR